MGTLVFVTQLIGYEFESLAELASLQANFLNELPIFQRGKDFVALRTGIVRRRRKWEEDRTWKTGILRREKEIMQKKATLCQKNRKMDRDTGRQQVMQA